MKPPIDPTQLANLVGTLIPESEDPYEYLPDLTPDELLNRRIEINLEIKTLEKEKGAVDSELQRIYSDSELQWGVRGSSGWILRQRTRSSWQYPPYIKDQIQTIQKSAQRSGDATELRTTHLVLTQEDS